MRVRIIPLVVGLMLGFLFLGGGFTAPASAQTSDHITSLTIAVWPEYDDPRVLVQFDGDLTPKEGLPREVTFYYPTGGEIFASAYVDAQGQYLNTDPPKVADAGNGYSSATLSLKSSKFHFEYYYNPLKGSPDKSMDFVFRAAQPIDQVHLELQEPLKSSNFKMNPPESTSRTTDQHGFKFHVLDFPAMTPEQEIKVQASYTKTDPNPSVQNVAAGLQNTGSTSAAAATPTTNNTTWIAVGLIGAGLAIGGLALFAWWQRRRSEAEYAPAPAAGRRRRAGRSERSEASAFCTQCGRPLSADDNFCPHCGAKRRG